MISVFVVIAQDWSHKSGNYMLPDVGAEKGDSETFAYDKALINLERRRF
jgi:hypothetical protein